MTLPGRSPVSEREGTGAVAPQPIGQTTAGAVATATDGEPLTPDDAINRLLGPGADSPTPLPPELQKQLRSRPEGAGADRGLPGTGQRRDGQRRGKRHPGDRDGERQPTRGYPVLRSYVSREDPEADREVDPLLVERRERVNCHGMNRVLEYERQHQRHPREMPPLNPGYDVESDNATGQIERYIEVKRQRHEPGV